VGDAVKQAQGALQAAVTQLWTRAEARQRRGSAAQFNDLLPDERARWNRRPRWRLPDSSKIRDAKTKVRIHLVGHSFGGRLVTAVALGPDGQPPVAPETMTLLQAAFSHNGFAPLYDGKHDGFFRRVVCREAGGGPDSHHAHSQ